jgi:sulfatase modifying factor 1
MIIKIKKIAMNKINKIKLSLALISVMSISSCGKFTGKVIADTEVREDKVKADQITAQKLETDKKAKEDSAILTENQNAESLGFIKVDGGSFEMGSNESADENSPSFYDEKPVHKVTVSSFYIGKYEVTQREYQSVMGNNPSRFKGDNFPVEKVSFNDAINFCNKYNQSKGLPNAYDSNGNITNFKSYRLPTEAEWEYAARGGNKSQGYKYSGSNDENEVACCYSTNSGSKTHDVGTKKANELGIYDMSGNVWELVSDLYDENYYSKSPSNDPYNNVPSYDPIRVIRGGVWSSDSSARLWGNNAILWSVTSRGFTTQYHKFDFLGFRLSRTAP